METNNMTDKRVERVRGQAGRDVLDTITNHNGFTTAILDDTHGMRYTALGIAEKYSRTTDDRQRARESRLNVVGITIQRRGGGLWSVHRGVTGHSGFHSQVDAIAFAERFMA